MSNRSRRHPRRYPAQAQQAGGITNAINMNQGQQGGAPGNNPIQPAAVAQGNNPIQPVAAIAQVNNPIPVQPAAVAQGNNPAQPAAAVAQGNPNIAAMANLTPVMQQAIFAAIANVLQQQQPQQQPQQQQPPPNIPNIPQPQNVPQPQNAPPQQQQPVQHVAPPPQQPIAQGGGVAAPTMVGLYDGQKLDIRQKPGSGLFKSAMKPLDRPFTGKDLTDLINQVRYKSAMMNCEHIFNVTENGIIKSLLSSYGDISLASVQNEARQKWTVDDWGRQARFAFGHSLTASMDPGFHPRLIEKENDYNIFGASQPDGPTIFKVICDLVVPTTRESTQHLVDKLRAMRPSDYENSITDFNTAFEKMKRDIRALKGGINSLPEEVLYEAIHKAYLTISQDDFVYFMGVMSNLPNPPTHEQLMNSAEIKYNMLVGRSQWTLPSKHQQLLALQSQLATKTRQMERKMTAVEQKQAKRPRVDSDAKKGKKKGTAKKSLKGTPTQEEFNDWLTSKPADEKKVYKKLDSRGNTKKWNWCGIHERMVLAYPKPGVTHNTDSCLDNPKNKGKKAKDSSRKVKVKALKAQLEAILEGDASDNYNDDGASSSSDSDSFDSAT